MSQPGQRRSIENVGTGEGFAEDAHMDESGEGGVIGEEQGKLEASRVRYAKGKEVRKEV